MGQSSGTSPTAWGGMAMFLDNQVSQDDSRLAVTYAQLDRNLRDILQTGLQHGVKMVVSTVGSNLKDCAPFASLHRPGLSELQTAEWTRLFEAAVKSEDPAQAIDLLKRAAAIDGRFAELQYLWGVACLRTGASGEALQHFTLARDADALRFRADTRINGIIRRVVSGQERDGILLCDTEELLARRSPSGGPGKELFHDHVHLNFEGNHAAALAIAEEVSKLLPPTVLQSGAQRNWAAPSECARLLAWTDWNRYEGLSAMMSRLNDAPFTAQRDHAEQVRSLGLELEQLLPATAPARLNGFVGDYKLALAAAPDDWVLYKNYARLLQKLGDPAGAIQVRQTVSRLLPHDPDAHTALGLLVTENGKPDQALTEFQSALALAPGSARALNGRGLALAALKRYPEAVQDYQRSLRLDPNSPQTHLNLAAALNALGQTNEASLCLRQSLENRPNNAEGMVELGKMCLAQGWVAEAITNFNRALTLDPTEATAHFCLAGVMEMQRRWPEAQQHYAEAVRLRPDHAEARVGLGVQLGMAGKDEEALDQFSRAVVIKPGFLEGRLNLGVALLRAHRPDEAKAQFEEALRIRPSNPTALQYLQQLKPER